MESLLDVFVGIVIGIPVMGLACFIALGILMLCGRLLINLLVYVGEVFEHLSSSREGKK
jgi:hypothetical protein